MSVRNATGFGILVGAGIGGVAFGSISANPQGQVTALVSAWVIVVVTTLIPLWGFLTKEQPVTGEWGGFINGLGTGLGVFLLATGRVI